MPFIANASGWIFTEAARQPWIVYGLLTTAKGVSAVPVADVATALVAFVLVYSALGTTAIVLMLRACRRPLAEPEPEPGAATVAGLVY